MRSIKRFKTLLSLTGKCNKYHLHPVIYFFTFLFGLEGAFAQGDINTALLNKLSLPANQVLNVVIDTDTYNEIDDQFALVYALLSPEAMKVNAIYAAPFHNNRSSGPKDGMQKSYDEILRVLDRMNVPQKGLVYKGSDAFLQAYDKPVESEAARDLVKRAKESKGTLYVLTLGAPTNIASAILMNPEIKDKIVVIWLGGKGLDWKTAYEFNLKQDVFASQILFDSGVPLIQIPTEPVSSHLLTTLPELEKHLAGKNEISDYLISIFRQYSNDHFAWAKVIWDISVIAYIIEDKWVPSYIRSAPKLTRELTYSFDNSRHLYRVAYFIDRNKVFADMFKKIASFKAGKISMH